MVEQCATMRWQIDRPRPRPRSPQSNGLLVTMELVEDLPQVVLGNAGAGIPDLQLDRAVAYACGQQMPPSRV